MVFDLVAGDRGLDLFDHGLQQRNIEIGNADGAGTPFRLQLHQGFEHCRQVHVPRGPVHQIKVDVIEPQLLQTGIERPADRVGREVLVPDLGGDMQIPARDARCADRRTDRLLVAVHFRGVDMPVAEAERAFDRRPADLALHSKSAEPEPRQADALGLQIFHDGSLKTESRRTGNWHRRVRELFVEEWDETAYQAFDSLPAAQGPNQDRLQWSRR